MLGRTTSAWGADALTVSPYLGEDSLTPFVEGFLIVWSLGFLSGVPIEVIALPP